MIRLSESGAEFKNDKQQIIDHKGPFPSVSIRGNTKGDSTNRSKHKNKCDAPSDISICLMELCCEVADSQGHREEVEGIPRPRKECDLEIF
jgi:hypothetical protein